jgi:hypothetical protein
MPVEPQQPAGHSLISMFHGTKKERLGKEPEASQAGKPCALATQINMNSSFQNKLAKTCSMNAWEAITGLKAESSIECIVLRKQMSPV